MTATDDAQDRRIAALEREVAQLKGSSSLRFSTNTDVSSLRRDVDDLEREVSSIKGFGYLSFGSDLSSLRRDVNRLDNAVSEVNRCLRHLLGAPLSTRFDCPFVP